MLSKPVRVLDRRLSLTDSTEPMDRSLGESEIPLRLELLVKAREQVLAAGEVGVAVRNADHGWPGDRDGTSWRAARLDTG